MLRTIDALSVRTSQGLASFGLGRSASYRPSMRSHGLPDRQNIRRCIRVTVVDRPALRTRPFPHAKRQLFNDMPAVGASLRGRKPAVNFDHGLAVSPGLFFDHANGRSDGCVVQTASKAVVLTMPRRLRSSTQITSKRVTRSVLSLCSVSLRLLTTFSWMRATWRFTLSRRLLPFWQRARRFW